MKYRNRKIKADSTNSSMPPASDMQARKNINSRVKSGRLRGGQINHTAHQSKLSNTPTIIKTKYVKKAPQGAVAKMDAGGTTYYATQEIDFCMQTQIVETRYYIDANSKELEIKESVKYKINSVTYSDHFKAAVLYLHCKGTIPLQRLCSILEELSEGQIQIKEGTICKWIKKFHEESVEAREEIMNTILENSNVGVDESGWKVNGKRSLLHAITTKNHVYYVMTAKRSDNKNGPLALLQGYDGNLGHDHFKPYYQLLTCKHIECNAHVLRYLQRGIEEYDNVACVKLKQLFTQTLHKRKELLAKGIHQFSDKEIEDITKEYVEIIQEELKRFTEENPEIAAKYTPEYIKLMRRLLIYKENHLAYVKDFDVPFDNNSSERAIRVAKAKKKISGQSHTIESANYYASLLTVVQTSHMKKENTLETIQKIIQS